MEMRPANIHPNGACRRSVEHADAACRRTVDGISHFGLAADNLFRDNTRKTTNRDRELAMDV